MRVAVAVRDVDVYIEQPCASYEECLSVRRHTDRPFADIAAIATPPTRLTGGRPLLRTSDHR